MQARKIKDDVYWLGVLDWDRRLFDSLIPLPDGTSYNSYLVEGSEATALIDTVDPAFSDVLMTQLEGVRKVDYIISHHAEQDHSGTIPRVLEKYPDARVVASTRAKGLLTALLPVAEDRIITVEDGETLSLGNKTLKFIHTPWVHWPETMVTHLVEDNILFSCDLFGSHLATSDLYATNKTKVYEAAKRYYAEIMMHFSISVQKNMEKIKNLDVAVIAPSHGPCYDQPGMILEAYRDWVSGKLRNTVVLPFVSMHGSTRKMVEHLVGALVERGVSVEPYDLTVADIGKLASALVDAATLVVGTPTVLGGAHPNVVAAAYLVNALKPRVKYMSVIGSYSWGGKAVEQLSGMMVDLKVEILPPVLCKGLPHEADFQALDALAATIAEKYKEYSQA